MSYLGRSSEFGVRSRYIYTAAGSETSISGTDDNNNSLSFTDGAYVDVYLNGVLLVPNTDYNTTTANTIGGLSALAASDVVEIVVYDAFNVADTVPASTGGTFNGNVTANAFYGDGSNLTGLAASFDQLTDTTVSTSDPTISSNPSATGHLWLNKTSGNVYVCIDNTTGNNAWFNVGNGSQNVTGPLSATGGDSTVTSGSYKYHVFTQSGSLNITAGGGTLEYVAIAGGAGGGGRYMGGGGGAGGHITGSNEAIKGSTYTITVGGGGAGGVSDYQGTNGENSLIVSVSAEAIGGGGGGAWDSGREDGLDGGSGGGSSGYPVGSPGSGTSGQGNAGGSGATYGAPGGGGAGAVGGVGTGNNGGVGGVGTDVYSAWATATSTGDSGYYSGGGGGGGYTGTGGSGGTGGGGTGANQNSFPSAGTANTGGGGGGANGYNATYQVGGNGGSGIVIVRYEV